MLQDKVLAAQDHVLHTLKKNASLVSRLVRSHPRHAVLPYPSSNPTQSSRSLSSTLSQRIPRGAWDSHMHVIDPDKYALAPTAAYHPNAYSLQQAMSFESSLGIENMVLIQPSIYGHDNSCLLDALRKIGPRRARGVVSFDPATVTATQLREWHRIGVRAVRFNIQSNRVSIDSQQLARELQRYADAIRFLDWSLQIYAPMAQMESLEFIAPKLDVRVCIDHLGHPTLSESGSRSPYELPGFKSLVQLLEGGNTFVKLSAPYRVSQLSGHTDLEPAARELIRLKGASRIVFGTDWPHTRFEGLDIKPWVETILKWCGNDTALLERLFKGNAEDLWGVIDEH